MRAYKALTAALLVVGAGIAGGASFGAEPSGGTPTKADDGSRRVCRSIMVAGTHLSRRVCRTRAEWARDQDRTQEGLLDYQTRSQSTFQQMPGPL